MGKQSVCNDLDEMDTYRKFYFQSSYVENLYTDYIVTILTDYNSQYYWPTHRNNIGWFMGRSMRWAFVSPEDLDPAALIRMRDINDEILSQIH